MKISTILLATSLAANAALAAVFLSSPSSSSRQTPASPASTAQLRTAAASAASTGTFGSTNVRLAPSGGPSLWQQLHTDDPQTLTARLKAAGFPGSTAHAIALSLHQAKFTAARLAITGEPENVPYWKVKTYSRPTPEQQARLDELSRAQSDTFLASYLNADFLAEQNAMNGGFQRRFGNLDTEKIQQLLRIEYDYGRMHSEMHAASRMNMQSSAMPPEVLEKIALLEKEKLADMRELLSPEEFAEFERRSSPTASRLQQQTSLFRPTEQEYKALFAIHRAIDEQLGLGSHNSPPDSSKNRNEALKNAAPKIEAVLGPDRYADYVQASSGPAQQLNRLLVRLDLPLRTATQIEAVRNDMKKRGQELSVTAKNLPKDQQIALAQSLVDEAKQKLSPILGGQRGLDAYAETAGSWLREVPTR